MELIQRNEGLSSILTVKIVRDDYKQQVEKALKKARQTAQVRGFRPGNVPMPMIKKLYERSYIAEEVSKMVQDRISQYLSEEPRSLIGDILPCNSPVDWKNEDFEFSFEVGFYPAQLDFDFDDEANIIPYYNITVRPEDVDNRITLMRQTLGYSTNVETAESGDLISATCELTAEDGTVKTKYIKFLIRQVPEEYRHLFIGARSDDQIDLDIRKVFPNEIDLSSMMDMPVTELETLPPTVGITVVDVSRFVPAEMNQDFFDKVGENINSEEDLRAFVEETAKYYHERISLRKLGGDAMKFIVEKTNIALPEDLVKRNLVKANKNMELSYIEANLSVTIESMKRKYIIDALLQHENISVSEEEVVDKAWEVVRTHFDSRGMYNMDIRAIVQAYLQDEKNVHQFITYVKEEKFALIVKTRAKLDVREINIDEFRKLDGLTYDNYENDEKKSNLLLLKAQNEPISLGLTESTN